MQYTYDVEYTKEKKETGKARMTAYQDYLEKQKKSDKQREEGGRQ